MTVKSIKRVEMPNLTCPGLVVIETNSPVEDVVATGWLGTQKSSITAANNGEFQFKNNDVLLIYSITDDSIGSTFNFYQVFPDFRSVNPIGSIYPNLGGIVAAAGGGQTNASQLNLGFNCVETVITNGDSVRLPDDVLGQIIVVSNLSANTVNIFPAVGDRIDSLALNQPYSLAGNNTAIFFGMKKLQWFTITN